MNQEPTGKTDCELYDHVPTSYDVAFWYCINCGVELDFVPVYSPKHPKPESKTSDEVVEEVVRGLRVETISIHNGLLRTYPSVEEWSRNYLNDSMEDLKRLRSLPDSLRSTLTALVDRVREEARRQGQIDNAISLDAAMIHDLKNAKIGDKAHALLQSVRKEGALAVLADLEGKAMQIDMQDTTKSDKLGAAIYRNRLLETIASLRASIEGK